MRGYPPTCNQIALVSTTKTGVSHIQGAAAEDMEDKHEDATTNTGEGGVAAGEDPKHRLYFHPNGDAIGANKSPPQVPYCRTSPIPTRTQ